jgi:hypothetical protein
VQVTHEPPSALPHTPAPGMLVVEVDGVMVRYHDRGPDGSPWHEVKLGIVGGWTGARPDAHVEAPSYVAAREKAAPFARRLGTEAGRRGALDVVGWRGHAADGGGHEAILRWWPAPPRAGQQESYVIVRGVRAAHIDDEDERWCAEASRIFVTRVGTR